MKLLKSENGFSVTAVLVLIVVVALVGIVAYRVKSSVYNSSGSSSATNSVAKTPPEIKSQADVKKAANSLQSLPISSELNPDQLNGNIKELL